jgi:hypothetical protein
MGTAAYVQDPTITNNAQGTVESSLTFVCHRVARRRQYHVTHTLQDTLRSMCSIFLFIPRTHRTSHPVRELIFLGNPVHSLVVISTELSRLTLVSVYTLSIDHEMQLV